MSVQVNKVLESTDHADYNNLGPSGIHQSGNGTFKVADNGFAISVPASDQAPAPVSDLVRGFRGLDVMHLDGTDYFAVRRDVGPGLCACSPCGVGRALALERERPSSRLRAAHAALGRGRAG